MDHDMVKTLVKLIEECQRGTFRCKRRRQSLAVVGGIEADYQNNTLTTVLIKMSEGAEFMAYSTTKTRQASRRT